MIKMEDIITIAKMSPEKRKEAMQKLFAQMFKEDDAAKVKMIKGLITEINKADDETYIGLCTTNMGIASELSDDQLKGFVALRMKANSELPPELQKRDMKMMQATMQKMPLLCDLCVNALLCRNLSDQDLQHFLTLYNYFLTFLYPRYSLHHRKHGIYLQFSVP